MSREVKLGTSASEKPMHYSVGALIVRDGKYLLIDRVKIPLGFAGLAGHIDEGESPEQAIVREVQEESGLHVTHVELLFDEEVANNQCARGVEVHHWYLFACDVEDEATLNAAEARSIAWHTVEDLQTLPLEPVWRRWFTRLNIL